LRALQRSGACGILKSTWLERKEALKPADERSSATPGEVAFLLQRIQASRGDKFTNRRAWRLP
jgi:hypothetical protein